MICPFRIEVIKHYAHMPVSANSDKTELKEISEEEIYPECYGDICPFYDYTMVCSRVNQGGSNDSY